MRLRHVCLLSTVLIVGAAAAASAAERREEPLAEKVRQALDRGVKFLLDLEAGRGHWEVDAMSRTRPGGWTALTLLALLNAGVPPEHPAIDRGLKMLRQQPPELTYVVGLQTMVFHLAGRPEDRERIQRNVDWLVAARVMDGPRLQGWGYHSARGQRDNSNTQYALLGLHEGHLAGAKIDREVWESIRDYYVRTQSPQGGWGYQERDPPSRTMTVAGLCGLIIAGMDLNAGRETIGADGVAANCGNYEKTREVAKALDWISANFPSADRMDEVQHLYYWLYGVERAGRLTGLRYFGRFDWYREGCDYLVSRQKADGSWSRGEFDATPVLATSFAVLFLSKGRTPILVSKLVHGPEDDWNNDRSDARNLVEFTSRELFKKQPLGWQIFDVRRAGTENKDLLLADLLQTPIVYFNGHLRPTFTGVEVEGDQALLKQYIENGGFLLAEACCGDQRFDQGFRNLMKQLFPDNPLKKLAPNHPIWRATEKFAVPPNEFELWGIEMGCKTVVVYSPQDLSCWWESNQHDKGRGRLAFRLGANIIAYATGMEPPQARQFELKPMKDDTEVKIQRGFLKVAQIKHEGDWQPAPRAMRNLMAELRKQGLDVVLQTETIRPTYDQVDYKFLYMHGRREFTLSDEELKGLRFNLETGGLLFADACCGSKAFDKSFRALAGRLWPERKERQLQPIPLNDELFSKELNNTGITRVRCRREGPDGRPEPEFRSVEPELEGIKVNGRWVLIYSKYDIGCALEKQSPSDCLGHDPASALQLGTAVVLYGMKR